MTKANDNNDSITGKRARDTNEDDLATEAKIQKHLYCSDLVDLDDEAAAAEAEELAEIQAEDDEIMDQEDDSEARHAHSNRLNEDELSEFLRTVCVPYLQNLYSEWADLEPLLAWWHHMMTFRGILFFRDTSTDEVLYNIGKRCLIRKLDGRDTWISRSCGDSLSESAVLVFGDHEVRVGLHVILLAFFTASNNHMSKEVKRRVAENDFSDFQFDSMTIVHKDDHERIVYSHLSERSGFIVGMTINYHKRWSKYRDVELCSKKVQEAQKISSFDSWPHGTIHLGDDETPDWALFAIESAMIFCAASVTNGLNTNYIDACSWPTLLSKKDMERLFRKLHEWLREVPGRTIPPADSPIWAEVKKYCGITPLIAGSTLYQIIAGNTRARSSRKFWEAMPLSAEHFSSQRLPKNRRDMDEAALQLLKEADPVPAPKRPKEETELPHDAKPPTKGLRGLAGIKGRVQAAMGTSSRKK